MSIYIAGVDIGNATTETALGRIEKGCLVHCVKGIKPTTGVKGTKENVRGILQSLKAAAEEMGIPLDQLDLVRINEATPVIGDFAMETITETVITESTLIGHNPDTPGGLGLGIGKTADIRELHRGAEGEKYVAVVPEQIDFFTAVSIINEQGQRGIDVQGAILKKDDGVLVANRLTRIIPIVDEVESIERVPLGMLCAVEVAPPGRCIDLLSNPYGIATAFGLSPKETKQIVPLAKALIGSRSAVVIKTPKGEIKERRIPAGEVIIYGGQRVYRANVDRGAEEIMSAVSKAGAIIDVTGTQGTNVGGMLEKVRGEMAALTEQERAEVQIKDLMAVDTIVPREVQGNLANEFAMEKAVGIAAMVKTHKLHMERLAAVLAAELKTRTEIGGVEGTMAVIGALTTPGTEKPLLVIDIGAGSTDACLMNENGETKAIHLAGAGNMVTMLINAELGLQDVQLAEEIKKFPLAKVESLYHIRHEDGTVEFFQEAIDSQYFARVVIMKPDGWRAVMAKKSLEAIRQVRRQAKEKVLICNILRALKSISLTGNLNEFEHVVLVGGSSLDFELGNMVTEALSHYGIVSGKANIRGVEGPRNAVATGLLLSHLDKYEAE